MQNDMSIRCAVLAADGRSFCAGADFAGDGVGGDDEVVGGDATLALYQGSGRLFDVTLPIVGAIQGPAVGGGLGLAMVPDIRITCPDARFSANFASLGIHQGFGMSVTLPQLLGPSRAQVLYSAKRYKGEGSGRHRSCRRMRPQRAGEGTSLGSSDRNRSQRPLSPARDQVNFTTRSWRSSPRNNPAGSPTPSRAICKRRR